MAMTKKLGTELQTGVTSSGLFSDLEQSGEHSAGGELKTFYDKDGTEISVYVFDDHTEYKWTALLPANVTDKKKGDPITVGSTQCYVTEWTVTESNNDVKRVNISCRTTEITVSSGSSQSNGTGGTGN